jgi:hypothetical protein
MMGAIPIIAENRIREAIERGEFDFLEGAGRPLEDLGSDYNPNWWIRRKLEREEFNTKDLR